MLTVQAGRTWQGHSDTRRGYICYKAAMELKHFRTLLAIREHGSFTSAARSLGITQAAVSQHVLAVEGELGVKLFDRLGRNIELTPAGQRFCEDADRVVKAAHEAVANVRHGENRLTGTLHIASSTVPSATVLPVNC